MMMPRNITRWVNATLWAVLLAWGAPCANAEQPPTRPTPDDAMSAYQTVDAWVRTWDVPLIAAEIDPPGTYGACVTLRLRGRVIGRGTVIASDRASIWRAARDAWLDAQLEPGYEIPRAEGQGPPPVERLTLDIQLAGRLVPLTGGTFDGATSSAAPGWHGVAGRIGDRTVAIYPSEQIERSLNPSLALNLLVGLVELPDAPLKELRARGFTPYRFEVTHLAQVEPSGAPFFLNRSGSLVSATEAMQTGPLAAFADATANYLIEASWAGPEPHGLRGTYRPIQDEYRPAIAPPREQALVAMALSDYAQLSSADPLTARRARDTARQILLEFTEVTEFEEDPLAHVPSAAGVLLASARVRLNDPDVWSSEPRLEPLAKQALGRMLREMEIEGWGKGISPSIGAMIAYALVSGAAWDDTGKARAEGEALMRALLRATPPDELVSLMPWVVWCEQELANGIEGDIPSALAMIEARGNLWRFQLAQSDLAPHEQDLAGGIVLTRTGPPLPTAQAARPLAGAAAMLADPRLTTDREFNEELANLSRSMRFLMQLSIRDREAYLVASRSRAIGGIRLALWDYTISLDATSMSLIAVTQMLDSAERRLGAGH